MLMTTNVRTLDLQAKLFRGFADPSCLSVLMALRAGPLTAYTATLARRKEHGMPKALGAQTTHLYRAVPAQALISVGLGFVLGLLITLALSAIVPYLEVSLSLQINGASLIRVGGLSIVIAGLLTMAIGPMCGMSVEQKKAIAAEWNGHSYYFCARGCRDEFMAMLSEFAGAVAA